jgi:hypothetical protein
MPVTGHGGSQGCDMSKMTQCPDNGLTETAGFVSLSCQLLFTPARILVLISVSGWVDPRATKLAEGFRSTEKSHDLNRNRIHDLLVRSLVPQTTRPPHAPHVNHISALHLQLYIQAINFLFLSIKLQPGRWRYRLSFFCLEYQVKISCVSVLQVRECIFWYDKAAQTINDILVL